MFSHITRFLDDRRSANLPRSQYRLDHFDPQPEEVLKSLIVPGFFLLMSSGMWIAVLIACSIPKAESVSPPDPEIVNVLSGTNYLIKSIRFLNDPKKEAAILKGWEEACQEWIVEGAPDGSISHGLASIGLNLRNACELAKPETNDPLQLLEYDARHQGFLNGAMRSAERLRKLNGVSFAEAHGSSHFLEASTAFLDEVAHILSSLRELRATQPSLEAMNAIKQLQGRLPESFIRIPATAEVVTPESQAIEKLFVLVNTSIKDYENLCQGDGSWNDARSSRAECTKQFYQDLREAEALFSKTENDIVGLRGIASVNVNAKSMQRTKKASFHAQ